ncbi:hypothetical protein [Actinopolymorpha sp. B9G3]|uniref:hypothetical protein n=1 Tax=Actinopolymorpha sp. B9G3 TaxID=3158970 RepID=UPI0032D8E5AA
MDFRIISESSTNIVTLGEKRDEVRERLGEYRSFKRTPGSDESDQFLNSGVLVTYSSQDRVIMLEFVAPAQVTLADIELMNQELEYLVERLATKDLVVERDDYGGVITPLAVGLYAPSGVVEGVQIGGD